MARPTRPRASRSERELLMQSPRIEGRIDIPERKGQRADPARGTDMGLFP